MDPPAAKVRKVDWNEVIIKELRKVFMRNNMKFLKKMDNRGKVEDAPWREWFDVARERGVHTELPEDILSNALARYSLASMYSIPPKLDGRVSFNTKSKQERGREIEYMVLWKIVFEFCGIDILGKFAQVCSCFNEYIRGYSIVFPTYNGRSVIQYKLPPTIALGSQDFTFFARVKPASLSGTVFSIASQGGALFESQAYSDFYSFMKTKPHGFSFPMHKDIITHVCLLRCGKEISLLLNGICTRTYTLTFNPSDIGFSFYVGCSAQQNFFHETVGNYFKGEIQGARLWFSALPKPALDIMLK